MRRTVCRTGNRCPGALIRGLKLFLCVCVGFSFGETFVFFSANRPLLYNEFSASLRWPVRFPSVNRSLPFGEVSFSLQQILRFFSTNPLLLFNEPSASLRRIICFPSVKLLFPTGETFVSIAGNFCFPSGKLFFPIWLTALAVWFNVSDSLFPFSLVSGFDAASCYLRLGPTPFEYRLNVFYSLVVDSERKVGPTHAKRYGMRRVKRRRGFFGGVPGGNGAFYEMMFGTLCRSQTETALLDDKASLDIKQSLCHFRTEPLLSSNRASVAIEQNLCCYQTEPLSPSFGYSRQ